MNLNDRELLARTLQAEAGNQGFEGMIAAGSVIMNRLGSGGSLRDVILKPAQFSAWNSVTGYAGGEQGQNMNFTPSQEAYRAADALLSGQYSDPTGGATHYYNPSISTPAWGQEAGGDWKKIGSHLFGTPSGQRSASNMRLSTREGSLMDQMQQPQQPMGLMDRLRDPRTRLALSALSRSSVGQRLGQLAASDLQRQQALEDEQRKLGQTQQKDNRTAAWLRTQPSGKSYADAIEKGGIDAKTIYAQYVSDRNDLNSPNVQSSKMLPDNSGSVLTMRDGSLVVKTVGGQTLTGEAAMEFVSKAEAKYVENQQNIFGARRTGTLQADVELGGAAEAAKAEGTVTGKAAGQAKLDLPKIESQGLRTIALIDSILSGPFQDILGPVQGRVKPDTIGAEVAVGRDGIGLIVKLGQLQGTVFLQAFESLKGGGQITELEGAKAEAAAARLNRFQSPQDFAQALNELRDVISEGIRSAQRNAQTGQSVANPYKGTVSFQQGSAPAQGSQPAASEQPATQSDWTDVGGGVRIRKKTP